MKLQSFFLVLALFILSSNVFANENSQSTLGQMKTTNADTSWLFDQDVRNFLADVPENYVQDYEKIYFHNKCYSDLGLVARYKDLDGDWVTDGPWRLDAGERGYLFDTRNTIIYFYAASDEGHRWMGNHNVNISGYIVPMQEVRMNFSSWGTFTLDLNCK